MPPLNPIKANQIISGLLSSPNEIRSVEYKPSFPWPSNRDELQANGKAQEVIVSILGMSNIRSGGKIILGVQANAETKHLEPKGMSAEHLATFDHDKIFEHVRNCGEPEPRFQVENVELDGMNFIVFAVQPFLFAPVISKNPRQLEKLSPASLYIRTDKPETKKVDDPAELREIVDFAIEKELDLFSKRMQRTLTSMSKMKVAKSTAEDQKKFEDEMRDL